MELISRREFFDYAEAYNLVVWSKECSDRAMSDMEKMGQIIQTVKEWQSEENGARSIAAMLKIERILELKK